MDKAGTVLSNMVQKNRNRQHSDSLSNAIMWSLIAYWYIFIIDGVIPPARVVCRLFRRHLNVKQVFTHDFYEAVLFQQHGTPHTTTVIFDDPNEPGQTSAGRHKAVSMAAQRDMRDGMAKLLAEKAATSTSSAIVTTAYGCGDASNQLGAYGSVDPLAAAFSQFDADGGGYIDENELARLMEHLGYPQSEAQLRELMAYLDTSGDGFVGLDEFRVWWNQSQ